MLLRFEVSNFLSIREKQELSLVASSLRDGENGLLQPEALGGDRILPIAFIYGANASGKSNLVSALSWMRSALLHSHSRGEAGGRIARVPFGLDPDWSEKPTTFAIDFISRGIRYYYGFEVGDREVEREWLNAWPHGHKRSLFKRAGKKFSFGRGLKGQNHVIAGLTRPNSLFVSAALQNDHEQISDLFSTIRNINIDDKIQAEELAIRLFFGNKKSMDSRVLQTLSQIESGITGFKKIAPMVDVDNVVESAMNKFIQTVIQDDKLSKEIGETISNRPDFISLGHRGRSGREFFLPMEQESAGTRRLLLLLHKVFAALDNGSVLLVDELDSSLHSKACELIVALFTNTNSNSMGAQLIATTHDTNLLNSELIRRDEIWFVEKNEYGATQLYPLTDISTRRGDDFEKGYLQGRFGAVPFTGPARNLIKEID